MIEDVTPGLTHKTKAQLIDIILRKDDVHRQLNQKIKALSDELSSNNAKLEEASKRLEETNESLKNAIEQTTSILIEKENEIVELKSQYDCAATEVAEAKESLEKYKICAACAIIVALGICFYNILFKC